jgi:ABC-type transporter Mla maintaining outer membrane lipid asymmetry ATPase subunit MlaF/ABC-type transporter Mla maintaining outer membrane lipid asymmetry permease subunit MlaE
MTNAIDIKNLTVITPNGDVIFDNVSFNVPESEISIFIGGSGSGKSVLMKILSGLIHEDAGTWQISGSIKIFGEETINRKNYYTSYIFQDFALFEDLTLKENLAIAYDHSPNKLPEKDYDYLMEKIYSYLLSNIPDNVPIFNLSGGQKQRVAIARALVFNPKILIFDEPNAGLDPKSAMSLAKLLKEITEKFNKTSLIILHHTKYFLEISKGIFLINPIEKNIIQLEDEAKKNDIEEYIVSREKESEGKKIKFSFRHIIIFMNDIAESAGSLFIDVVIYLRFFLFPYYKKFRWGAKYFWHYFKIVGIVSISNIIYLTIAGVIIGFVATYFVFKLLPYRHILEPLLLEELIQGIGYTLYRIMIPVIATILIAAKNGAIIAADISTRRYSQQILAMQTLNIPYKQYLLTGILWSFVINTPLLVMFVSFYASKLTSLIVFKWSQPELSYYVWNKFFNNTLGDEWFFVNGWKWVLPKTAICGLLIGIIAFYQGDKEKRSIKDVNQSVTYTIVISTIVVLLVHFVFAFFEYSHKL